jgi:hypothetical protein
MDHGVEAEHLGLGSGLLDQPSAEALPDADLEDDGRPRALDEPVERERAHPPQALAVLERGAAEDLRELTELVEQARALAAPVLPGLHVHAGPDATVRA